MLPSPSLDSVALIFKFAPACRTADSARRGWRKPSLRRSAARGSSAEVTAFASEQPDHQQQLQPQRGVLAFFTFLADVPAASGRQRAPAAGRSGATIGAIGGWSSGAGASVAAQPSCPVPDMVRQKVRWSDPQVVLSTTPPPARLSAKVSWPAHGS